MLQVRCSPRTSPASKMLKENIARTIEENNKGFGELARRDPRLPVAYNLAWRLDVPSPSKV